MQLRLQIYRRWVSLVGAGVNPDSPKQVSEVLRKTLNRYPLPLTPTGQVSTREPILKELKESLPEGSFERELVETLLAYREVTKLLNTYVEGIEKMILSDGRVRPSWRIHGTVTGRVSCHEPSLQQIPAHGTYAETVRRCFVADDGYVFLEMDFSNHELRVAASLAKDKVARDIFLSGRDIHKEVAAYALNKSPDEVTKEERQIGKGINFGLLYGMSVESLARTLKCSPEEAQTFVERYKQMFPEVWQWREQQLREAREKGYVTTPTYRKRHLPHIKSDNPILRARAEREALNAPVQGFASDICLMVACRFTTLTLQNKVDAVVLATIHDSILVQVRQDQVDEARSLLQQALKEINEQLRLFVPAEAEIKPPSTHWTTLTEPPTLTYENIEDITKGGDSDEGIS